MAGRDGWDGTGRDGMARDVRTVYRPTNKRKPNNNISRLTFKGKVRNIVYPHGLINLVQQQALN